jgi:hypothetical protein
MEIIWNSDGWRAGRSSIVLMSYHCLYKTYEQEHYLYLFNMSLSNSMVFLSGIIGEAKCSKLYIFQSKTIQSSTRGVRECDSQRTHEIQQEQQNWVKPQTTAQKLHRKDRVFKQNSVIKFSCDTPLMAIRDASIPSHQLQQTIPPCVHAIWTDCLVLVS